MSDPASIRRGDIILVPFPYSSDFSKSKTRPALVIQNNVGNTYGSTVIVALISSSIPAKRYPMHFAIAYPSAEANAAGLTRGSVVKMETLVTLPRAKIVKRLGALTPMALREADVALAFSLALNLAPR